MYNELVLENGSHDFYSLHTTVRKSHSITSVYSFCQRFNLSVATVLDEIVTLSLQLYNDLRVPIEMLMS